MLRLTILLIAIITAAALASCQGEEAPTDELSERPTTLPDLFARPAGMMNAASGGDKRASNVEDALATGLHTAGASPAHIAFRGTANNDSARCQWRGVARTPGQREETIRFWLELEATEALPSAAEAERRFTEELDGMNALYPATVKDNFLSLARGGLSTGYQFLTCYVDYTVTEYIVGSGQEQAPLTVAYDHMAQERSFDLYVTAHAAGEFGDQERFEETQYQQYLDQVALTTELAVGTVTENHESIVFLAPMGAHSAIAVEAWQAIAQWDLRTDDEGQTQATRYGASPSDPEYSQSLSNLKSRITTAATTDAFAGKRIANISGLNQYYRDIGAYGDITPDDGSEDTFTPDAPPPPPVCAGSTAVGANPGQGLLDDCNTLIAVKDTLAGAASLNWTKTLAMASWDGISIGGSPQRVTAIELSSKGLTGTIPQVFTRLSALSTLKLSGNTLTGCIPGRLRQVPTHDLNALNLRYCDARAPSKIGLTATQVRGDTELGFSWQIPQDGYTPITGYQLQLKAGTGEFTDWSPAPTTEFNYIYMPGLAPGTTYKFRIRAINAIGPGKWSPEDQAKTTGKQMPVFPNVSYGYDIYPATAVGDKVGGVSATLPSGDTVTYSLSTGAVAGSERYFNVNRANGNITLARALNYPEVDLYPIVVKASAPDGGETRVPVFILVKPRP